MNNKNQSADNNLETNLGKALIEWVRTTKGRNQNRYNVSDYSYERLQSYDKQNTDFPSIKTKHPDSKKNRKRNFYRD
jgi:hypothetical protein